MTYALKEIFFTLQGEGAHAGRAAVFARFAGCNLWSGREEDRAEAACWFCDTDFIGTDGPGGGKFATPADLAAKLRRVWDTGDSEGRVGVTQRVGGQPYVVFTGGEPMLQLDGELLAACHGAGLEVGVETNGTLPVPEGVDWICVSPKPNSEVVQRTGHELKLVHPHEVSPESVQDWEFEHFFLQPRDSFGGEDFTAQCVAYCMAHPQWQLSMQTHKMLGIP
ncbi:MAG: 7-carboxy-7-deazaguanine synthase [Deltaproteobacteria bacterium]|nr:7-carboxy-7-deazaguanine synthase [Deltaproteobacteria bacterium]